MNIRGTSLEPQTKSHHLITVAAAVISLLLTIVFFLPLAPRMPTASLDSSWKYAVNEVIARHLIFGRDFIFTSGPLESAYTELYHPATDHIMLLSSALLALGLYAGYTALTFRRHRIFFLIPPLLVMLKASSDAAHDACFMALPLLLLLAVFQFLRNQSEIKDGLGKVRLLLLGALTTAIGILPLIKGSFAVEVGLLGLIVVYILCRRRRPVLAAAIVLLSGASLCLGWSLSGQPLKALSGFFIAQIPIISGYTEAMSSHGPFAVILAWFVLAFICLAGFYWLLGRKSGDIGFAATLGVALYLYVVFKAAFVRDDSHHAMIAVDSLAYLGTAFACILETRAAFRFLSVVGIGWLLFLHHFDDSITNRLIASVARTKSGLAIRTNAGLADEFARANEAIRAQLPFAQVKGSLDIYPVQLTPIFAFGADWSGRPIPQSYSSYTPELAQKNAAHLQGATAPDHIFFNIDPIDNRLASLEDSASWPILLTDYRLVGVQQGFMHLEHSTRVPPEITQLATIGSAFNRPVAVPDDGNIVLASIEIKTTLLGSITKQLFKLPALTIETTLDDGRVFQNRYIAEIGKSPFVVSPYVGSTQDFLMLAVNSKDTNRVKSIKIVGSNFGMWRNAFTVTYSSLRYEDQTYARKFAFAQSATPPSSLLNLKPTATSQCNLDRINGLPPQDSRNSAPLRSKVITLAGWAIPSVKEGIKPEQIWVGLKGIDGNQSYYQAKTVSRPDLGDHFKQPAISDSGFDVSIDANGLSGPQELSIYTVHGTIAEDCGIKVELAL